MERSGEHRADIAEKDSGQNLDRAGFPQDLRHADRAAHEQKNRKIDFAELVPGKDTDARERRREPNSQTDNGWIQMMDEIRRPEAHPEHDPECGLLLRGSPPSKPLLLL